MDYLTKEVIKDGHIGQFKIRTIERSDLYDNISDTIYATCPNCGRIIRFATYVSSKRLCLGCRTPIFALDAQQKAKNGKCLLYYIKFSIGDLVYYKIGVTDRSVYERFSYMRDDLTVLYTLEYCSKRDAMLAEQAILTIFNAFRIPKELKIIKSGNTEIFTKDVLGLDK